MTQNERVLEKLKDGQWLPMPQALHWSPPFTRLGARIHDLRKKYGHHIIERRVPGKTWSEYKLIPPQVPALPPAFEKPIETAPEPEKRSNTQALFQ